ncbi:lamin tail domain-containing protein [Flavobacterium microcysteis]
MAGKKILFAVFAVLGSFSAFSQVAITEINYDTPYIERTDLAYHHLGEYIELYNYTTEDLSLKGWSITDNASKYVFPDNVIIPSQSFIIVAYRDPFEPIGNYFTTFFPTTVGKESQIFYQGNVMFRNKTENISLNVGFVRGTDLRGYAIQSASWFNDEFDRFFDPDYSNPSNVNFYLESLHLNNGDYFAPGTPTPLTAAYVPPTQNLEDIAGFQQASQENYAGLTWETYSNAILAITCPLVINVVQQNTPWGDSLLKKCFSHDASGNMVSTFICDDSNVRPRDNGQATEYNNSELDDIASKIILYPNPTSTTVNVQWDGSINGKITQMQVFNTGGINISNTTILASQSSTVIDLSYQPTGIYIVRFLLNSGQFISKNVMKI